MTDKPTVAELADVEEALRAIGVAIDAMKAANIDTRPAMVGMMMLSIRIARQQGIPANKLIELVDNAWRVAGAGLKTGES